ncbi:MAG: hypothetical protein V4675_00870 [Verrucomicrobiota bacterium]
MNFEKLGLFLLSQGFNLMALLSMLLATAFLFSRFFLTFWAVVAIAFTLMQRGCNQGFMTLDGLRVVEGAMPRRLLGSSSA